MGLKINGIPVAGLGLPGKDGKSAYEIAQAGGYQGSEAEFAELMATIASQSYVDQKISEIPTPDVSRQIQEHNTSENAHAGILAPMYTYGTEDLTAGTSPLASGQLHFVYE